jgi:cobalt-zinc-cadmium efflux system protein
MSHAHAHDHAHGPSASRTGASRLVWTLALVLLYAAAEVVGGLASGSLALLADAGHMVSDAAALGLTLFAMSFARRTPTPTRTFGYFRAEILAALVNGATLVGISLVVLIEAIGRLRHPAAVEGPMMLAIASGGLAVNLAGLYLLRDGRRGNLNVRGAWLHVLTDTLGSVQAIVAAAIIARVGWTWVDPVASIGIALLIVASSWSLVRQSVSVLMEGAPADLDPDAVRQALAAVGGVEAIHDFHLWSISTGFVALSAHLVVPATADPADVLRRSQAALAGGFGIRHTTLQLDLGGPCAQTRDA